MRSYKEITARYLKSNKRRTILTIIGIILSMSLLTSAGVFGESLKATMLDGIRQDYGNYHVAFSGLDESQVKLLQNNAKVDSVGYSQSVATYSISKNQNLTIFGGNRYFYDVMYYKNKIIGKLPKNDNEIALEKWVLDAMNIKGRVGEHITLDLYVAHSQNGFNDKSLKMNELKPIKKDFILSGIIENKNGSMSSGQSIGFITTDAAKKLTGINDLKYTAFVTIKKEFQIQTTIKELQKNLNLNDNQVQQNNAYLTALSQSGNNSNNNAVTSVELIVAIIIIITTIAVIYNAFHISTLERIHQFGVLRSIGATPRQIRTIVLREALLLSAIGIPLGLLFGTLAVKIAMGIFMTYSAAIPNFTMNISPTILILSATIGLVTILISAYGPAISAGRVSPMEAILNNARQSIGKFKRKRHPIIEKIIGIESIMAYENLKRNKGAFI